MKDTILRTYKYKRYHQVAIDGVEFGQETSHIYSREDADNGVKIVCGVNCKHGVVLNKKYSYRHWKDIEIGDTVIIDPEYIESLDEVLKYRAGYTKWSRLYGKQPSHFFRKQEEIDKFKTYQTGEFIVTGKPYCRSLSTGMELSFSLKRKSDGRELQPRSINVIKVKTLSEIFPK